MGLKHYIFKRLKERSTWIGIITMITSFGFILSPEQLNAFASISTIIIGAILAGTKDKNGEK